MFHKMVKVEKNTHTHVLAGISKFVIRQDRVYLIDLAPVAKNQVYVARHTNLPPNSNKLDRF